jgi:hypothetical protein
MTIRYMMSAIHRRNRVGAFLQKVEQSCLPDGSGWSDARQWFDEAIALDANEMPHAPDQSR